MHIWEHKEMSEQYTYPPQEHYVFPKTRAEVIAHELDYSVTPEDLRKWILNLTEQYGRTPIMSTLQKYSLLIAAARIDASPEGAGSENERPSVDEDFYFGSLMGVHTTVHNSLPAVRSRVLAYNHLQNLKGDGEDAVAVAHLVNRLKEWESETFELRFIEAPEELQEAVFDLAAHIYCDMLSRQDRERSFMSGFIFATNLIDRNITTPGPV